jgi:hypothetical protein
MAINHAEELTFANQTFTLNPDSLKYTIEVFDWPFLSITNLLEIWASVSASSTVSSFSTKTKTKTKTNKNKNKQKQKQTKTKTKTKQFRHKFLNFFFFSTIG